MRTFFLSLILLLVCSIGGLAQTNPKVTQALSEFDARVETEGSADSHLVRGMALYRLGQLEAAQKDFEAARTLEPLNDIAWYWSGCSHFASNRFSEAAECFSHSISLDSDAPWFYHQALGDSLYHLGRVEEVVLCFERAVHSAHSHKLKRRVDRLKEALRLVRLGIYETELPEPIGD